MHRSLAPAALATVVALAGGAPVTAAPTLHSDLFCAVATSVDPTTQSTTYLVAGRAEWILAASLRLTCTLTDANGAVVYRVQQLCYGFECAIVGTTSVLGARPVTACADLRVLVPTGATTTERYCGDVVTT